MAEEAGGGGLGLAVTYRPGEETLVIAASLTLVAAAIMLVPALLALMAGWSARLSVAAFDAGWTGARWLVGG